MSNSDDLNSPYTTPSSNVDKTPEIHGGWQLLLGLVIGLLPPLIVGLVATFSGHPEFMAGIGLLQLALVIPLVVWAKKQGRVRFMQGLLIMAGLVFLANAACFGILMNLNF